MYEENKLNQIFKIKYCLFVYNINISMFISCFQRKHSSVYDEVTKPSTPTVDLTQHTLDSFVNTPKKYRPSDPKQKQMTDSLVLLVACELLPFSLVESAYFKDLLSVAEPRFQIPSRKHLTKTH